MTATLASPEPQSRSSVRRPVAELRLHAQADLVPAPDPDAYAALRASITTDGVGVPLEITAGGTVLDGRARLAIAKELGIAELPVAIVEPVDEVEHMLRRALHRRHLSPSQRAVLAVQLFDLVELRHQAQERSRANLRGGNTEAGPERATLPAREGRTRDLVASISGASPRTVEDALKVQEHDPQLLEQVFPDGRYWARTSDPQLVDAILAVTTVSVRLRLVR